MKLVKRKTIQQKNKSKSLQKLHDVYSDCIHECYDKIDKLINNDQWLIIGLVLVIANIIITFIDVGLVILISSILIGLILFSLILYGFYILST